MSGEAFRKASDCNEAEPIAYAPTANVVSVRGFRLLVFLTLVNTVLLGGFVLGPQFFAFGKGQWAEYQQRKAERERLAKTLARREAAMAAEAKAMAYTAAPGTLVYDDDPARRDLPSAAGAPVAPWPSVVPRPEEAAGLPRNLVGTASTVLFMHELRASATSLPRLVVVLGDPKPLLAPNPANAHIERRLWATSIRPTTTEADAERVVDSSAYFRLRPGLSLRLYAGEADPNDASRFTIPYEMAGERGLIHGQLQGDDSIRLIPDGLLLDHWPKQ